MEKSNYSFGEDNQNLISRPSSPKNDALLCNVPVTFRDAQEDPQVTMRNIDSDVKGEPEEIMLSPPRQKTVNL